MRKRAGTGVRGRAVVAIVLGSFLVVTTSVVWRRSVGSTRARTLQRLGEKSAALESERARLEADIRVATSRARLTPAAQRLGLRMPNDSQVINLARPRLPER